jgi:hypothetical protein
MAIHKLAMGPITMNVVALDQAEGNFGPQICFTGDDGTQVYVSLSSATSQLDRLKLNFETAVGQRLHFEQVKKDGKTFTNINRAGVAAPVATGTASAGAVAARPAAPTMSVPELGVIYAQCVDAAMMTIGAKLEETGVPFDGAVIQAAAATLFIKATR